MRSWFGVLVSAVENEMGRIEVAVFEREMSESQHRASDLGKDGVAMLEESIETAGEAVIVEFFGRDVAKVFDAVLRRPAGDVDQGGGMIEPSRQKDVENGAVRVFRLGIGRDVAINDVGDAELVEQRHQNAQGGKIDDGLLARPRGGEIRHSSSVKRGKPDKL